MPRVSVLAGLPGVGTTDTDAEPAGTYEATDGDVGTALAWSFEVIAGTHWYQWSWTLPEPMFISEVTVVGQGGTRSAWASPLSTYPAAYTLIVGGMSVNGALATPGWDGTWNDSVIREGEAGVDASTLVFDLGEPVEATTVSFRFDWTMGIANWWGLRINEILAEGTALPPPDVIEFDVYQPHPDNTAPTFLVTLSDAQTKMFRAERNAPGSGQFTINRHSDQATATIIAPGNLVKVRVPAVDPDYIFAFWMETGDFGLISSDEEGGEVLTIGGRGILAYWDRAIWLSSRSVEVITTYEYEELPHWWPDTMADPPAGARGCIEVAAGTYRSYTIAAGVITGYTDEAVDAFSAYFDVRRTYQWPAESSQRFLVHLMTGETHAGWYFHPHQSGVTETVATYAVGGTVVTGTTTTLVPVSLGQTPGQMLYRMWVEATATDRPIHPIGLMTVDFGDAADTDSQAWTVTAALDGLTVTIGEDFLTTLGTLTGTGELDVEMGPDFVMHAYNSYGNDRTGADFAEFVVRFEAGVGVADELRREMNGQPVATWAEIAGTEDVYAWAELADAGSRIPRETSLRGNSNDADALQAVGLAELEQRLEHGEAVGFAIVALDDELVGHYLPGPDWTDHGKFWLGDWVTLHTGTGDQDYNEVSMRVAAVTLSQDANNLIVTTELGATLGALDGYSTPSTGAGGSLGGGGGGGGGGSADTSLFQVRTERGIADGYASLNADGDVPISELPVGTAAGEVAAGDHSHTLDGLSDVSAAAPGDGNVLAWDDGTGAWVASAGGGGAPTDADYLVGTASGGLSAEIVVGATPGGELGGTWASPTVDATHSGSAHLALGATSTTAAAGDHTHGGGGLSGAVFHIVAVFDAGASAITGNPEVEVVCPADGTLSGWTLLGNIDGGAVIDVWKDVAGSYPPTDADSITNGHEPTLTAADYATDADLSDWTSVALTAGDIIRFRLDSSSTVSRLVLTLTYTRS